MPCASVNTLKPRLDPSPCDYHYMEVKIKMNHRHLRLAYWKAVNYQLSVCPCVCVRVCVWVSMCQRQRAAFNTQTRSKARSLISMWSQIKKLIHNNFIKNSRLQQFIKYARNKRCCQPNGFNRLLHQTQFNIPLIPHHLHTSVARLSQPINPGDECGHRSVSPVSKPCQLRATGCTYIHLCQEI